MNFETRCLWLVSTIVFFLSFTESTLGADSPSKKLPLSLQCKVLSDYLQQDENAIVSLVKEIRAIEETFGIGINGVVANDGVVDETARNLGAAKIANSGVNRVLASKKKELKFALHNLERHHLHSVRSCGVVQTDNHSNRCQAVKSALSPSLRYVEKLRKQIKVAEANLKFLKKRDVEEEKSKKISSDVTFLLKWANVPPFLLSVASGVVPLKFANIHRLLDGKKTKAIKNLGLPFTGVLVGAMLWNTGSKRKSAAIHLDYMQTNDLLRSAKEELKLIESRLLTSIGDEYLSCNPKVDNPGTKVFHPEEQKIRSCFVPKNFNVVYEDLRDSLESKLDERILSSGLGFYDRDFDQLETEEVTKMLGIALGEIVTLVASSKNPSNPLLRYGLKGVSLAGAYVFGYSLYKSIFSKDKFESLKGKYFDKHRTLGEIQSLEEELAYLQALDWVQGSVPEAGCQ